MKGLRLFELVGFVKFSRVIKVIMINSVLRVIIVRRLCLIAFIVFVRASVLLGLYTRMSFDIHKCVNVCIYIIRVFE